MKICMLLVSLMAVGAAARGAEAASGHARLTVDVAGSERPISPLLYGIFFEDINHAADGGLYAELVRNRSFDDTVIPEGCTVENNKLRTALGWTAPFPMDDPIPGWKLVEDTVGRGTISLDDKETPNPARARSLRIEIAATGAGRAGAANEGFWGIPLKQGAAYRFSMFAKGGPGFSGPVEISLESVSNHIYANGEIKNITPEWKRYELTLHSSGTDNAARLVVAARQPGVFWIDTVSLLPEETWKQRPNGLRTDLAEMLAGMKPAFVRFPGGCFVEGFTIETALRWKKTVGPIEQRKGHWNLWGYRTTDGLGYHELLEMCEGLGAEPLLVINCGMMCQGRGAETVPMDQLDAWVQDALDAVEYANGPADSQWGAARVANGHPAPFHLRYIEIGNENSGPNYDARYRRFYEALKARYPEVQLIANAAVNGAPMDILDEHYYSSPDFFAARTHQYDTYDRKGPKIYVGEYAVTKDCGNGNLRAAVAEAAFMTGMERNGDIVVMSSYAPLFVNVNDRTWNPDAIGFDNTSCYGTPSYHVQCMFSRNRGDSVLPCTLECDTLPVQMTGGIGLSTWETLAEFKDVRVTQPDGKLLYASDFNKGASEWKMLRNEWKVVDCAYRQSAWGPDRRTVAGDVNWTDYTLSLKARKIEGREGFLILFRVRDEQNWVWFNLGGWNNRWHGLEQMRDGQKSDVGSRTPGTIETGRWYDVQVEVKGTHVRCSLDGKLVQEAELPALQTMAAVASRRKADGTLILKIVNTSQTPQETEITLNNTKNVAPQGTAEVLASPSPDDENSIAEPKKVAPKEEKLDGLTSQFRRTLPADSVTILKIAAEPAT